MQTSEQINELAAALAKAQGLFTPASKDAENEAFKRGNKASKYADIAAVWDAVRKPLSDNGLSVIQQAARVDNGVAVTTQIMHASGQWMRFDPLTVPMMKQDAHGVGSATTYGRRFSLCAALGIVADADDDGNAAAGTSNGNGHTHHEGPLGPQDDGPVPERTMTKQQARPEYDALLKEMLANQDVNALQAWGAKSKARRALLPEDWQLSLKNEYSDHKANLLKVAAQ